MKTSESCQKIIAALIAAQKQIKHAVYNSVNPHHKNKYANLQSVIEAIKYPLLDNNIAFFQLPGLCDDSKLVLTTRLTHESGEYIECTTSCTLPKNDPHGYGSALTYLRRYSLSSLCGLYADEDDDANMAMQAMAKHNMQNQKSKPQPASLSDDYYKDLLLDINDCTSMDGLRELYKSVVASPLAQHAKDDLQAKIILKKSELTEGKSNA